MPLAAQRLLSMLPTTTHLLPEKPRKRYVKTPRQAMVAGMKIRHKGKLYESHSQLMRALRIGHKRLLNMIRVGTAVYE